MSFREFLSESFLNYFIHDKEKREMVVDEVWDILQDSYRPIGGIHGNGFRSKEDMIKSIPFWKLVRRGGKIVTVVMYRDKAGRKMVAAGTDGSTEGKNGLAEILSDDLKRDRSYTELSGKLLSFVSNTVGESILAGYLMTPEQFSKVTGDEISDPPSDDPEVLKHSRIKKFFYQREIGGVMHTKVAMGTPGLSIKNTKLNLYGE